MHSGPLIGCGIYADDEGAVVVVLTVIHRKTAGRGGIMAIDRQGRMGTAFTTPDMAYAGPACRQREV